MDPIKFESPLKGEIKAAPVKKKTKRVSSSPIKDQVKIGKQPQAKLLPKPQTLKEPTGHSEPGSRLGKKWTILLYSAADNNLERYMIDDVDDLEKAGSDENLNLVVQLDYRYEKGAKRYYLQKDSQTGINSPVLENLGKINMSDPKVLADFIKWGVKNYPAEHYFLILSDHGGGWDGALSDNSHSGWMTTPQVEQALKDARLVTGKKIDILGMDACLMGSTEFAHQLKDQSGYLVASQANEGADGWPYTKILTSKSLEQLQLQLKNKLNLTPSEFAKKVVAAAATEQGDIPTLSAVDLARMSSLSKSIDALAKAMLATATPASAIKGAFSQAEDFGGFKDLYDACEKMLNSAEITDESVKTAAKEVMKKVSEAVIAEEHASYYRDAHGLHIEAPSWYAPGIDYQQLAFAKDTQWDEALKKLTGKWLG